VMWLRMYALWERRDLPGTETYARLVTAMDPRPVYFWLNAARIVAYDLTAWRIQAAGGYDRVTRPEQDRIAREQGEQALRYLAAAVRSHPTESDLWIERANIEQNNCHDLAAAAASYRAAALQPGSPFYAARLHAELLRRLGRNREALEWLRQLHITLPRHDRAAEADLVLARIRDLERQLSIPATEIYRPPPG
jgi:tetratricopeptide (TPR) repeat protein